MDNGLWKEFADYVKNAFNLDIEKKHTEALAAYLRELTAWNKDINLTKIEDERGILYLHFADSLAASLFIKGHERLDSGTVLDIGAGAGFPSMPLKILYPQLKLNLLESRKKKCYFLENIARKLKLENVTVINSDAEACTGNRQLSGHFDMVTARALGKMDFSLKIMAPFASDSGYVLLWLTGQQLQELRNTPKTAASAGLVLHGSYGYCLPGIDIERHIAVFCRGHEKK